MERGIGRLPIRMILAQRHVRYRPAPVHSRPSRERRRARRASRKPEWLKVRAPGLAELSAAEGAHARAQAAHGLRGSALPQHRRVLAPRHGDVHDHGRRLHARVRLLQRHARRADRARSATSRRISRTPSKPSRSPTSSSRRSIAMTSRTSAPARSPRPMRAIKARRPECRVEVLIPDFQGHEAPLRAVLEARPDVLNHNTETVPRLYRMARPGGTLHARARAARPRPPLGAGHSDEDRPHGRPRRDSDEVVEVCAIFATSTARS